MIVVLLVLATSAPPWCTEAAAAGSIEALASVLPNDAPVVARFRELADDDVVEATAMLRFAVADACTPGAPASAEELAARTKAIMADPRFTGVRNGDGAFDRVLHKLWLAFVSFLESQGMQRYAGSARLVYLSVLGLVAALVAVFILRALARQRREASTAGQRNDVVTEAARRKAFATLREEAGRLLAAGEARAALRAADQALLARVGELDSAQAWGAVTPARTHREIVAKLPMAAADVVRAPFASFEALFFGRATLALEDARAFLGEVDAAEARFAAVARAP